MIFLDNNFRKTPILQLYDAMDLLTSILREKEEDILSYITKFDAMLQKGSDIECICLDKIQAALMQRKVNLTEMQTNSVTVGPMMVNLPSKDRDPEEHVMYALQRNTLRKAEEIVLINDEDKDEDDNEKEDKDEVLFGEMGTKADVNGNKEATTRLETPEDTKNTQKDTLKITEDAEETISRTADIKNSSRGT